MPNDAVDTVEPGRLIRASQLAVRPHGPGEYEVQGSRFIRYVNLNSDLPCDCEDAQYRGQLIRRNCKHVLAARLLNGDWPLIQMLGNMLLTAQKAREESNV